MKLLLIDDHPLFLEGFAVKLEQSRPKWGLRCVTTSAAGQASLAADPTIDMALIDLQLPDCDGFETLKLLAAISPIVPRIIVSGREDLAALRRARQSGASGFIFKSSQPDTMIRVIEAVAEGQSGFAHLADVQSSSEPALSPRQIEVLNLLGEGCSNKEMRYRLGIAERTVRAHLTELFQLLGVHSRIQAILSARAIGLIP